MPSIYIEIPGQPVPWRRADLNRGQGYLPKRQKEYKHRAQQEIALAMRGKKPLIGPVALKIEATLPIPRSWSKKRREAAQTGLPHTSRPDATNLQKMAEDCLIGFVIEDDSQVVEIHTTKRYGPRPGLRISVHELP